VRGHALRQLGKLDDARAALTDAANRYEVQRSELGFDALKPWLAHASRLPLEDLFAIAVQQGKTTDAFDIAQRATARSILDGLVSRPDPRGTAFSRDLAQATERVDGLKILTRTIRSSKAARPPAIADVLAAVHDRHLLTYFRARDTLWLIDVPAHGEAHAIEIGDAARIKARVTAWREAPESRVLADELGAMLLPVEVKLGPEEIVYVVVDEPIRSVAFSALRRSGAFVVEHNPVVYEPSAAVLVALRAGSPPSGPAVVFGNATKDLPDAEIEANEVAKATSVTALVRDRATRSAVLASDKPAILHIATHTTTTRLGAALVLADGPLGAGDILDHGIAANLVVLSSCASANALDRDELGPLASAFLAAGARTVVATRFAVRDDTALAFTRAFYAALPQLGAARAVAAAQRQLLVAGTPIGSWSNFVVAGM
jgi:CHAT domain-containing protein